MSMMPVQDTQHVAIVGMACRFPAAPDVDTYWAALLAGRTSLAPLGSAALDEMGVPLDVRADPAYVPVSGDLDGVDLFDAAYFGIPPAEAAAMDPQHRLFLQEAVHALEHAGWAGRGDDRKVGVFCGAGENRYAALLPAPGSGAQTQRGMSDTPAALPLRVSYHLDLRGPSVFVSSLCSTSLTAVHLARRSLLAGECELALAGAVSVRLPQQHGYRVHDGGVMSPDGALRPFDARARGTVPGSGVGAVVLKRLADALRDGDTIHAVIRGSALNNDGSDRQSFAAPSVRGQRDVVIAALRDADVDPSTIGYIEAHGTGTPLGDPVELAALREARGRLGASTPCAVGAVKSSVGHLDTAAGMAGLLKAVLAVREGMVPATVGHDTLNPLVEFGDSGLYISTGTHPWPLAGHPRRAAVTALGVGGTNAHMVLEEPPVLSAAAAVEDEDEGELRVFPLSARSPRALDRLRERLAATLAAPVPALRDVAYTLQHGRTPHPVRRAWVAGSRDGLAAALHEGPDGAAAEEPLVVGIALGSDSPKPVHERLMQKIPELQRALDDAREGPDRTVRTGYGLLECLHGLGIRPHAVAAVSGGEFLALAHAGALPRDVALRCAARHLQALASTGGDMSECERLLLETEDELRTCSLAPPAFEVRAPALAQVFTTDRAPVVEDLTEVTRAAVMGEDAGKLPSDCPDLVAAAADWGAWLRLLAHCWERGADIRWDRTPGTSDGCRVPMPGYPFDEERHWAVPATQPPVLPASSPKPVFGTDDVATELADIWRTVLGVPEVVPDDSFFALGGHSLLAAQIMTRIRERFEVRVPLGDLLDAETLAGMAQLVEDERAALRVYAASSSAPDHAMETVEL